MHNSLINARTTISSLRDREVISICDGKRLGYVCDAEVDLCSGKVCSLILPGELKCLGFARQPEIYVPFDAIERIGSDVILVDSKRIFVKEKKAVCKKE